MSGRDIYFCSGVPENKPFGSAEKCRYLKPATKTEIIKAVPQSNAYLVKLGNGEEGYVGDLAPSQMDVKQKSGAGACDKRGGVAVGMTRDQVLKSCWGAPRKINETLTARGKHEQFVYPGGYLYLDDDVVTAIQTTR